MTAASGGRSRPLDRPAEAPDLRDRSAMRAPRARLLLLALSAMSVASQSACLVPPDGERPATPTRTPPVFDLESLNPATPVFTVNVDEAGRQDCRFDLEATIEEVDNCFVGVRVVADNRTPFVREIFDSGQSGEENDYPLGSLRGDTCVPPPYRREIQIRARAMNFLPPWVGGVHTISLFVKDTTRHWLIPRGMIGLTETFDAGALEPLDAGESEDGDVVELRWFVIFNQAE